MNIVCPQCLAANQPNALFCGGCGIQFVVAAIKKKNTWLPLVIVLSILGLCGFGGLIGYLGDKNKNQNKSRDNIPANLITNQSININATPFQSAKSTYTPEVKELELVKAVWTTGGFGTIAIWKVTIKNNTDKKIGDIKFRTAYLSETRNIVSKGGTDALLGKDTIQKVVPPKSTRTFEVNDGFVSDEANTATFEIVSWLDVP